MHMEANKVLQQNQSSWNAIADEFFGVTALPEYGCLIPTETELGLFDDVAGKRMLDIGCGSGHSLLYHGQRGAAELWGLDISSRQLENAQGLLSENGYAPKLFHSPMEQNPGLPPGYFDVVYSIYAMGWTTDLKKTFQLVASYLKPGGMFIFSWDHPFMHSVSPQQGEFSGMPPSATADGQYVLDGGYLDNSPFSFLKNGMPMTVSNYKVSDYINALAAAGFCLERMVEETDAETLRRPAEFSSRYYAPSKAKLIPLSFVMKARKL